MSRSPCPSQYIITDNVLHATLNGDPTTTEEASRAITQFEALLDNNCDIREVVRLIDMLMDGRNPDRFYENIQRLRAAREKAKI